MNKNIFYIIIIVFIFNSCNKEYFPEENACRDSDLFGTWQLIGQDTIIIVFTEAGYYDIVNYYENDNFKGYTNLDGIWHISKKYDTSTDLGEIYSRSTNSNLSHRGWERYEDYKFSIKKDTLFKKLKSSTDFEIFTRYKQQLIYDGPNFVRVDSSGVE